MSRELMRGQMTRDDLLRAALRHSVALLTNLRLVGLHLVVNALLMAAASFWLLIPEEHIWQLFFAVITALLMIFVLLWLHSGTFVFATASESLKLRSALSIKLQRMAWLLLCLLVFLFCVRMLNRWNDSRWQLGGYLYAMSPHWMRPTSGESSYVAAVEDSLAALEWYVLPSLFLPLTIAKVCGKPLRAALRAWISWFYWACVALCVVFGVWIPGKILDWIPGATLHAQTVGLIIRLSAVYLLATGAWLFAIGLAGSFLRSRDDPTTAQVLRQPVS